MDDRVSANGQSGARASPARRLPTRVSSACDRCRKLKQRCDVLLPCSNCVNANRECTKSPPSKADLNNGHQAKRPRVGAGPRSTPNQAGLSTPVITDQTCVSAQRRAELNPSSMATTSRAAPVRSVTSASWLSDTSREDRSIVAEFGNSSSAMDITRRVLQQRDPDQATSRATFAIPGGDFGARRNSMMAYHPVSVLIGVELPSRLVCDKLLDIYFVTVHWFSLVVYEPTFRRRYEAVMSSNLARSADRPFLLLVVMVLVMACQYSDSMATEDLQSMENLDDMRVKYLKTVRQHFMDLLDEDSLEFVQICTLLGSYWLYWGKPRSSFTILGAAVKSAQAISLHRQANWRIANRDTHMVEESKRVWWTIYTWDRFATVVYGRPLGISDKDCDILMPTEFTEHIVDPQTAEAADIVLSSYQTQLNTVYQLASPLLENIYGIRSLGDKSLSEIAQTVQRVSESMQTWYHGLPTYLDLNQIADTSARPILHERMHGLQALSLHLTYLNLMIIIHRPLLADWRSRKTRESRAQSPQHEYQDGNEELTDTEKQIYDAGFDQCLKAALSVSQLERSKPSLIHLAGETHLMSFLAMNVFTSSVVLFICACSDTLSDASQEAKRGLARNLRIMRTLSYTGTLPSQCSTIIQDFIQIVIEKEKEQMLLGPTDDAERFSPRAALSISQQHRQRTIRPEGPGNNAANLSSPVTPQPIRSHNYQPANEVFGLSGMPLGRTMEQLHRVLKNTSQARATQHVDITVPQPSTSTVQQNHTVSDLSSSWANPMSWDAAYLLGGETYAQDMNQFWLWNMDNENQTNWSTPDWE